MPWERHSTVPLRPTKLEVTYALTSTNVSLWRVLLKAVHSLTRPRSSGDRAVASGAMSAGSNPAEGATQLTNDFDVRVTLR